MTRSLPSSLIRRALLAAPAAAQPIVIDDFSTNSSLLFLTATGTATALADGAGILQTERNLRISGSSFGGGASIDVEVTSGAMAFTRTASLSSGTIELWWDGDNNTTTFNATGLGGVNLTAGGQDRFVITVNSSTDTSSLMGLQVWTDGTNRSEHTFTLPGAGGTVTLPYANFVNTGGTGADFSNVGAIFLRTADDGAGVWVASIEDIRTQPVELLSFEVE